MNFRCDARFSPGENICGTCASVTCRAALPRGHPGDEEEADSEGPRDSKAGEDTEVCALVSEFVEFARGQEPLTKCQV